MENIIFLLQLAVNWAIFSTIKLFFQVTLNDFRRLRFLAQQCTHMVSPCKDDNIGRCKLLPTINLCEPETLSAWTKLRRLGGDYGREFQNRQYFFLGTMTLSLTVLIFGLIGLVLDILPVKSGIYKEISYQLIFDILVLTISLLVITLTAADIHSLTRNQVTILWRVKSLISELLTFNEFYFRSIRYTFQDEPSPHPDDSPSRSPNHHIWPVDWEEVASSPHMLWHPNVHSLVGVHRLHRRKNTVLDYTYSKSSLVTVFVQLFRARNQSYRELIDDLQEADKGIRETIGRVEWANEFQSPELIGFKLSHVNIGNFVVALLSIFGALIQNYIGH